MTAIHWKSGIGGNFDDASRWSTATVPGSLDDALIDASGTYTVESLTARTVHSLTMAIGATLEIGIGDFTLDFFGADTNNGTINVYSHLTVFGALDNTGVIHCFGAPIPNVPPHPLAYFQPLGTSTNSGTIEAINDAEIFFNISPVNGPASFTNYGIIEAFSGSIITIGGNFGATSSFTNVGTIEALGQGSIVDLFSTSGTITNSGHLVADGGTIQISNPNSINGSGTADIRNGGTLFIGTSFAENTTFDPGANGTLQLASGAVFTGTLSGFTTGDRIDFAGLQCSGSTLTFDPTNDVLTVSNGGYAPTINLSGSYVTSGFKLSADASGFAQVTYTVPPASHPPQIDLAHSTLSGTINERPNMTGSLALDIVSGAVAFTDQDLSDRPTASVVHQNVAYQDGQGHVFTLTDDQVFNFENAFLLVPESGNTNNGKIDWGFTIADNAVDFLGVGETLTVVKTVEMDDGHGGNVDQDVTVTINGADDAPIAKPDFAGVQKGRSVSGNVLAKDSDPDLHDTHDMLYVTKVATNGKEYAVGQQAIGAYGTLTWDSKGDFTYFANEKLGSAASAGAAVDTFTYTVSDGHPGGTATSELSVQVLLGQPVAGTGLDYRLVSGSQSDSIVAHLPNVDQNFSFLGEYIGDSTEDPSYLTANKANQIIAAGIQLFSIYEHKGMDQVSYYTGTGSDTAYQKGLKDGESAYAAAVNDGQGNWKGSAIYFGAECPVSATNHKLLADLTEYFKGVEQGFINQAAKLTNGEVLFSIGIYGYGAALDVIKDQQHLAMYSWLSGSPAAKEGYNNWDIEQVFDAKEIKAELSSVDFSHTQYIASDVTDGRYFGQWGAGVDPVHSIHSNWLIC